MTSKLHCYRDFAELVDFTYRWSCIGKGLRLRLAHRACFVIENLKKSLKREFPLDVMTIIPFALMEHKSQICLQLSI